MQPQASAEVTAPDGMRGDYEFAALWEETCAQLGVSLSDPGLRAELQGIFSHDVAELREFRSWIRDRGSPSQELRTSYLAELQNARDMVWARQRLDRLDYLLELGPDGHVRYLAEELLVNQLLPSFTRYVDQHRASFCRYAARVAGPDAAEDYVQDAEARAWKALNRQPADLRISLAHGGGGQFASWFWAILRNAMIDGWRREQARVPADSLEQALEDGLLIPEDGLSPDEVSSLKLFAAQLEREFGDTEGYVYLVLHEMYGLTYEEIGDLFGLPNRYAARTAADSVKRQARRSLTIAAWNPHVRGRLQISPASPNGSQSASSPEARRLPLSPASPAGLDTAAGNGTFSTDGE